MTAQQKQSLAIFKHGSITAYITALEKQLAMKPLARSVKAQRSERLAFNQLYRDYAKQVSENTELLGACRSALRALEDNLQSGPMDEDAKVALRLAIAKVQP